MFVKKIIKEISYKYIIKYNDKKINLLFIIIMGGI